MSLGFCYKGFHWPTIIVIMAEGKEDKIQNAGGGRGCGKKIKGGGMPERVKKTKCGGGELLRKTFEGGMTRG